MPELKIEIDEEALAAIEALAVERGVAASDVVSEMIAAGIEMYRGAAMLRERAGRGDLEAALAVLRKRPAVDLRRDDPLGYDTSDEDAAIRQMCDDALSGRNDDAVRAEIAIAERWFTRR